MRVPRSAELLTIFLLASESHSENPARYKIRESKPMKDVAIQIVSFDSVDGLDKNAIRRINAILNAVSTSFGKEAKECGAVAQGHPWGYELKLEKILPSEKYLSVVFSKSTVCGGSPDLEKEARVFSLPTGDLVPPNTLFKQLFPRAKIVSTASKYKELVDLDEEMVETMINDSEATLKNYDDKCEFYLKNTSYRIWIDGQNLILFPEFLQPQSFCQKEYLIRFEKQPSPANHITNMRTINFKFTSLSKTHKNTGNKS
ncbi:hypothetical protein NX784_07380 [Massilia pinisoli]|uniref:Uncharacterized protein n=1 Tax=Massilia pinisoli TaxID=1772194 RepID=A0ABT1ZND6_9BURK|nr:hypothetical protein [Massilia pinisoli]MCS0581409.1 hypothetical protein [Massilia pinisoli]